MSYAEVALPVSIDKPLTYAVPSGLSGDVVIGKRVLVPLGKRVLTGYVTALAPASDIKRVRHIIDVLDAVPLFNTDGLRFLKWMSAYYMAPLGQVLALIHPPGSEVKGRRFFSVTSEGRDGGRELKGLAGEVLTFLSGSSKQIPLALLLKSFKGRAIYSLLARLTAKGLIHEELKLTGANQGRIERLIAPVPCCDTETLSAPGDSTPAQKRIYDHILEKGETSLSVLNKTFGSSAAAVKRLEEKGLVTVRERRASSDPMASVVCRAARHTPNSDQKAAIDAIIKVMDKGSFSPFLLYGVTGSGKTLVYLEVLEEVVRRGGRALLLVPEIGLTSWAAEYLKDRFGSDVALYHSGLTASERCGQWRRILDGEARIIVGARSALFAPIVDISLIIVDEEHDPSYKQDDGVRYNGRDAALMLGKFLKIPVILGSATPAIETFYNCKSRRFTMLCLEKRVEGRPLPLVEIVDMKGCKRQVISERLKVLMEQTFSAGHQVLLFLNRRGFSSCLICRDCGFSFTCVNCSVTLTFHKGRKMLRCHYCGYSAAGPEHCPTCRGSNLGDPGMGTEKVESEVKRLFPEKRILRMDSDTTSKKGAMKAMMGAMETGEADVLIGTQMVSKGHHYPGITLVGIISGDTSLNIPDFRSPERTFQLVTQAAGRGGRGDTHGRVVIQSANPSHYALKRAAEHDYDGFYNEEITARKELSYPPFSRLALVRIEGPGERAALKASTVLQGVAGRLALRYGEDISCLGPAPALVARVKNEYRFNMLVKGTGPRKLHDFVAELARGFREKFTSASIRFVVEMDPVNIL